jgi:hypothetical protein
MAKVGDGDEGFKAEIHELKLAVGLEQRESTTGNERGATKPGAARRSSTSVRGVRYKPTS